jgi:hypothetical protein
VDGDDLLAGRTSGTLGLELYGYALAEDGSVRDLVAFASNLALATVGDKLREHGLQCHTTFTLPAGKHSLRFMVRDGESGRTGSGRLDVTVPRFDPDQVLMFPPLFMDERHDRLVLEVASRSTGAAETPFRVAGKPFTPRPRPWLVNGRTEGVCLMAYDAGRRSDPGSSFELRPELLDRAGAAVPSGGFEVVRTEASTDGMRRFVLRFTPAGVAAGDYTLRVRLRDPASGRVSESFQAVIVR